MGRSIKRMLVVATAVAGLLAAMAGPAFAHWHRDEIAVSGSPTLTHYGWVFINSAHTEIKVCDDIADNTGVWVEYYYHMDTNGTVYQTLHDTNGANNSCAVWTLPPASYFMGYRGRFGTSGIDESGWNWGDF